LPRAPVDSRNRAAASSLGNSETSTASSTILRNFRAANTNA
jgi:hypothetical protein